MNNVNVQEKVEKYQMDKRNAVTTTQLRLLLSNAVIIKNKIQVETRKGDEISVKLENEIKYLLVKHIYQCGREPKVKNFDKEFHISEKIKEIGNSAKKFNDFYRYLEEIVAYMKYYESDK
ncbi:type III-A CRISPR-associated protein Csm2 [Fusobacterium polymorphum]|uniref:CRISPR system Cms protein Csm2 n=1 Tax=Fusobacterium nucleatum subsp. polymorphum TaxID=76857 RepID=A0A2C6BVK5_FUSNP|nr:type III-A CRISPR-associated protein Csm2 [Fusobacterium polymorphum]PHI07875.1 type III-A CRISPR-associated protein Csm2 [Fusobacterium polymorphum]